MGNLTIVKKLTAHGRHPKKSGQVVRVNGIQPTFPNNKCAITTLFLSLTILFSGCEGILFPKSKYRNLPDLGNGYEFSNGDGNSLAIKDSVNIIIIETEILEYAFDSTFIVVSQRPWDVPDIPGIKEMTYDKRNEAFEKSTFRQYWIINKKEKGEYSIDTLTQLAKYSNVYGPFTKEEYLQKREELKMPRELKLKE